MAPNANQREKTNRFSKSLLVALGRKLALARGTHALVGSSASHAIANDKTVLKGGISKAGTEFFLGFIIVFP